jgi:hypothetical protein
MSTLPRILGEDRDERGAGLSEERHRRLRLGSLRCCREDGIADETAPIDKLTLCLEDSPCARSVVVGPDGEDEC